MKTTAVTLLLLLVAWGCHGRDYVMMTYNVENLFDCRHDSLKNDYEFLPDSARQWNEYRLQRKITDLSRVIVSVGGYEPLACIGLSEVENRAVVERMTSGPLRRFGYEILHHDSPDPRGIDVALIYNPKVFRPLTTRFLKVRYEADTAFATREILCCRAALGKRDTLDIILCHLPSQRAENEDSEGKRQAAFTMIKELADSIAGEKRCSNIVVMGDFNCGLDDKQYNHLMLRDSTLKDLTQKYSGTDEGTYCYKGIYSCLDHVVATTPMTTPDGCTTLQLMLDDVHIVAHDWMLDKPNKQGVRYPRRTYRGTYYHGGISDHLPVVFTIRSKDL